MFPKYNGIKRIVIVIPFLFLSVLLHAQYEDEKDSTRLLSEDMEDAADSLVPAAPQEEIIEEGTFNDQPVTFNNYFLRKELQVNGGGPDSLQSGKLPDSLMQKLKKDNDFWYVDYVFDKEKKPEEKEIKRDEPFTQQPFFQTLLWLVIIGGFASFVIIYLSNSNIGLFRRKNSTVASDAEAEVETDNIFEINYQREIDKAVGQGNYRFAVRLMFLQLLKNLSDKKVIDYKPDRTDFDYLLQISSTKYYHDFFRLTRNYEFSWYGQFDVDPEKFTLIRKDFENFTSKLK